MAASPFASPAIHVELPSDVVSPGIARRAIDETLEGLTSRERDILGLLVSDLVTAPVTAGSRDIVLDVWQVYSGIRVEEHASAIGSLMNVYMDLFDRLTSQWQVTDCTAWFFLETSAPLEEAADDSLFESMNAGDVRAVDVLISRYRDLAVALARGFYGGSVTGDDMTQIALIALANAIQRFDPNRGVKFTSFAVPTIRGELKKWLRSSAWAVRVPRSIQELNLEARRVFDEISQRTGHEASMEEVAADLGTDIDAVEEALSAPWSNEALVSAEPGSEFESTTTLESIASSEDIEMTAIHRADLSAAIQTLPPRERRIIHLRFFEDLPQSDIAGRLGLSQMHVSRLLKASLGEIRFRLERSEGPRSPPREVSLR